MNRHVKYFGGINLIRTFIALKRKNSQKAIE